MALTTVSNAGLTKRGFPTARVASPLIINGDMAVSQRGTSFSPTAGLHTVDRLQYNIGSSATADATITQEDDAPDNTGFRTSVKITPDATETPTGSENIAFTYALEGQDVQVLKHGETSPAKATLSFWVKSNKTGVYSVQVKEETVTDEAYILFEYTISSSDTWEQKILTWTGNAGHAILNNNAMGFRFVFSLLAGADDLVAPTTTWTTGSAYRAGTNQVNFFDSTSNTWYLTGLQLEVGEFNSTTLPAFRHESYGDNLARCQRYFVQFGNNQGVADQGNYGLGITNNDDLNCFITIPFPTTMRVAPTGITQSGTAADYAVRTTTTDACTGVPTFSDSTTSNIQVQFVNSGHGFGSAVVVRGMTNADASFIGVSADL